MALISRLIGLQIAVGLFIWMIAASGGLMMYVDLPSLIIVGGVSAGVMLVCFTPAQLWGAVVTLLNAGAGRGAGHRAEAAAVFGRAYQVVWGVGLVGTLFGLIAMLADLSDPSAIGAGMAVALIMVAYSALLAELIIAPCKQIVLNDFHPPTAETSVSEVPSESVSEGSMMWKGVTVVSIMITVYFVTVVNFVEVNQGERTDTVVRQINQAFSEEVANNLNARD